MRRSDIGVGCRICVKSGRTLIRQSGPLYRKLADIDFHRWHVS